LSASVRLKLPRRIHIIFHHWSYSNAEEAVPQCVDDSRQPEEETENDIDDDMDVAVTAVNEDGQRR